VPFALLVPLAWAISLLFDSLLREGVLTLGLSSTEVAAVGLVALAGGDAALALGALAGSLVAAATVGPIVVGLLAADAAAADLAGLLGRFALVVLVPLAAGVAARVVWPRPDARRAVVRRRLDGCRGRAHLRVAQRHGGRRGSLAGARCERGVPRAVRSAGARLGTPGLGRPATPRWRSLSDYETSPSPPRSPHRHSVLPPPRRWDYPC